MGKSYVMFINYEVLNENNTPDICGVVFEEQYCTSDLNQNFNLKEKLERYKIDKSMKAEEIIELFNSFEYKVITNKIKNNNIGKLCYEDKIKNLLKSFNKYIKKFDGESGKIIFEDKKNIESMKKIQKVFDIYNEYRNYSKVLDKINTFIVCEKKELKYKYLFQICDIIYEVVNYLNNEEIDSSYGNDEKQKILNYLEYKYLDKESSYNLNSKVNNELEINTLLYQIENLKQEINLKNKNITSNNLTINKLKEEVLFLKEQIKLTIKNNDNVALKIFENNKAENKYSEV